MATSPENQSDLSPEQQWAFRVIDFNGASVDAVISAGEKNLPYQLGKDSEVLKVFQKARKEYETWSFMCQGEAVFNEKTAGLLLSLGVLTPEFFSVLLKKVRLEKYKKHLVRFLESLGHGQYLEAYFDDELDDDPRFHEVFLRLVLPRIADVLCAFKTEIRLDIESPQGKLRLVDDILVLLQKVDVLSIFTIWDEKDVLRVQKAFGHIKKGIQTIVKGPMLQDLAAETMKLENAGELDSFFRQIEERFSDKSSEEGKDFEEEPPRFDAGHGWQELEEDDHEDHV